MAKKYYWLKLKEDFFRDKKIKKLRRIAGGDTYTIIYLKMQLLSLKNEGALIFEGVEDNFAEEIALEIDEDVENVKVTIAFLLGNGLIEEIEQDHFVMTETIKCIGSETAVAERVRKHREKQKMLQCNTKTLQSNIEVTKCNTEIEKREKRKELEQDKEKRNRNNIVIPNGNDCVIKSQFEEEFEFLWNKYPNKKGKGNALKSYIKARKKGVAKEKVLEGLNNYLNYIKVEKVEQQFIKHGSTWFNQQCWEDDYSIRREVTTKDLAEQYDFDEFR